MTRTIRRIYLGKWVYAETCENTCMQVALSCIDPVVVIQRVCCDTVVLKLGGNLPIPIPCYELLFLGTGLNYSQNQDINFPTERF